MKLFWFYISGNIFNALARPADARSAGDEGRAAASALLERHPTHMLALRARALISANLARVAENELQQTARLAGANDAARDWTLLWRIDPGNAITRNNLGSARSNAHGALLDLGRPREALAKVLESRDLEANAASSSMVSGMLSFQFYLATLAAAELGQASAAEGHHASALRHFDNWVRDMAPGSFQARTQVPRRAASLATLAAATGEMARARQAAAQARAQFLQLQPADDFSRRLVAENLRWLHRAMGIAELRARDFAAAQVHFGHVMEARKQIPALALSARRDAAEDAGWLAVTLAQAGRADEARALAEPLVKFQREIHARKSDDQMHKLDLAVALLAMAQSTPAQARPLLAEAQAAFDSLPAEARGLRTSQLVQSLIAQARQPG